MNFESAAPLNDADSDRDETDSHDAGTTPAALGDSPDDTMAAVDRTAARLLVRRRSILLTVSAIAAVGLAVCLLVLQYLPDRQIDDAAARRARQAASDGAVAALSYSSESMDRDFARARSHLTGEFLAYYDKFTRDIVTPTVKEKHIHQTVAVVKAAVSQLQHDNAVVLLFLNETTTSKDKHEPLTTPSSVRVTLTKVGGSWLISKLDPLV